MDCDNCNKSFNNPPIEGQVISYYRNKAIPRKFCSHLCRNEYYKIKRCNKCGYYGDLVIHNGNAYCTSSEYWNQTCLQKVKIEENNVKCLVCREDDIALYNYINDATIICYDCCDKFNNISKDLTINIINDITDLYKCFVCKNNNNNNNKDNTNVQDQILLCFNCSLIHNYITSKP
jgi:hypothetical protein